jgi:hypothetical protein
MTFVSDVVRFCLSLTLVQLPGSGLGEEANSTPMHAPPPHGALHACAVHFIATGTSVGIRTLMRTKKHTQHI